MPLDEADKAWMNERLERVETTLLAEFHKWAQQSDQRTRTHKEAIRALNIEVEYLQHRMQKVEDHIKAEGN